MVPIPDHKSKSTFGTRELQEAAIDRRPGAPPPPEGDGPKASTTYKEYTRWGGKNAIKQYSEKLTKFQPGIIFPQSQSINILTAAKGRGKSTLAQKMIKLGLQAGLWNQIRVFCPNTRQYDFLQDPKIAAAGIGVILRDDEKEFEAGINKVMEKTSYKCREAEGRLDQHTLLVMDDIMGCGLKLRTSNDFAKLGTQNRHRNLTVIFVIHDLKSVPPWIRDNADVVFAGLVNDHNVKWLKENATFNTFGSIADFRAYMNAQTVRLGNFVRFDLKAPKVYAFNAGP